MKIRLHDGSGRTLCEFETDDLPFDNIWLERGDGQTIGSLYFAGPGLVELGQHDVRTADWETRAVLTQTEDEIAAKDAADPCRWAGRGRPTII